MAQYLLIPSTTCAALLLCSQCTAGPGVYTYRETPLKLFPKHLITKASDTFPTKITLLNGDVKQQFITTITVF